jgi:magnesium transporter
MTARPVKDRLNDPITRHLRTDFTRLFVGQTVGEALEWLRVNPPAGRIIYFYVVGDGGRLEGVVPTRRLVLSPPDTRLTAIMVHPVIAVPAAATVLEACEFFIQHRLLALPVVDETGVLLGQVDVELYTEEMSLIDQAEQAGSNEDLFQLIGVHLTEARLTSPVSAFRGRFPWLLCNVAGGLLAAFLSGLYADVLEVVAVALFIPVVLALAESVAIQSVSLALEALRGQPPTWATVLPRLRRELVTGGMIGTACGAIVGGVALVWLGEGRVAASLLGGIAGGVAGAAGLGLAIPSVLRLLKRDPHVAAGPVALVGADTISLLLYYNLARWLGVGG